MTYPLTPREDRIRILRARRDQLDALIRRLEDAELQDGEPRNRRGAAIRNGRRNSNPVRVGEVVPDVVAELFERSARSAESCVTEGDSEVRVWENGATTKAAPESGFSTASTAEGQRGPRRSSLEGVID